MRHSDNRGLTVSEIRVISTHLPGVNINEIRMCIQRIKVPMGPTWKDVKHVQLLDPRQREEDKKWDKEFQRRREELKEQRRTSDEKRVRNSAKLAEMSARWRSLEQKRLQKGEFYLERLRTSLSLTLRHDSVTPSTFSER